MIRFVERKSLLKLQQGRWGHLLKNRRLLLNPLPRNKGQPT